MLEFHAWFLSDNSINLYLENPGQEKGLELVVSWKVPAEFVKGATAIRFAAIDAQTLPNPTASWIAANGTHAYRFQCGPGILCYRTAEPARLPIDPSRPVRSITEIVEGQSSQLYLVTEDSVVTLTEEDHSLTVWKNVTWNHRHFFTTFPVDRITGVVRSYDSRNLLVSLSSSNNNGVGYVVNVAIEPSGELSVFTVTLMTRSPQSFYAHNDQLRPRLIYYWLIQDPYVDITTHNAFVVSSGGAHHDMKLASAVFEPGESWAPDVFLLEDELQSGLLASGNYSKPGFSAWSPQFAFGDDDDPEVRLRSATPFLPSTGFSKPRFAIRTWGGWMGQIGSVTSKNLNDGCWYIVILNWGDASKAPPRRSSRVSGPNLKTSKAVVLPTKGNCRVSNCDLDNPGDCPLEQCWALGALDGFQCCTKPPV